MTSPHMARVIDLSVRIEALLAENARLRARIADLRAELHLCFDAIDQLHDVTDEPRCWCRSR
jgi:cell division protein FtsB